MTAAPPPNDGEPLLKSNLPLERVHSGKVRDVYRLDDEHLLLVTTDRISAFDVVMPNGIPRKGEVLARLSQYWFERTSAVVPNAFVAVLDRSNATRYGIEDARYFGRSMVMRRGEPVRVECVVRGYLAGSGWADYEREGVVSGVPLPPGLRPSERLPDPLFTPSSKAEPPEHDRPITYGEVEELVGVDEANVLKLRSLAVYRYAAEVAERAGIIVADTKFEFGLLGGEPVLIDELLTPDSSRFWPIDAYAPGEEMPSFDKQFVRDWLARSGWDKQPPGPELPPDIVQATSERYLEAYRRLTGHALDDVE